MHLESTISVYPFGMIMPGRSYSSSDYRYGYQGSEEDKEINGGSYTTHFRQLDTRIGRWLSVDPENRAFPSESPYLSMGGKPIMFNDMLGDSITPGFGEEGKIAAERLTKDLNDIYENKYDVQDAFKVATKTVIEKRQLNSVSLFDPSSWGYIGEDPEYETTVKTQYFVVANEDLCTECFWETDDYTRAIFDITHSKDIINVVFTNSELIKQVMAEEKQIMEK